MFGFVGRARSVQTTPGAKYRSCLPFGTRSLIHLPGLRMPADPIQRPRGAEGLALEDVVLALIRPVASVLSE